jgi:hypothetical protein
VTIAIVNAFIGDHPGCIRTGFEYQPDQSDGAWCRDFHRCVHGCQHFRCGVVSTCWRSRSDTAGQYAEFGYCNFAQSFDKVRADIIKAAANESWESITPRGMLARKIVPDWTSQKQIREMIATVEVPKTPKPCRTDRGAADRGHPKRGDQGRCQQSSTRVSTVLYDGHQA